MYDYTPPPPPINVLVSGGYQYVRAQHYYLLLKTIVFIVCKYEYIVKNRPLTSIQISFKYMHEYVIIQKKLVWIKP